MPLTICSSQHWGWCTTAHAHYNQFITKFIPWVALRIHLQTTQIKQKNSETNIYFCFHLIENTKYFPLLLFCRVNHFDSLSCFSCSFNINQKVIFIINCITYCKITSHYNMFPGYSHSNLPDCILVPCQPPCLNYSVFKVMDDILWGKKCYDVDMIEMIHPD